MNTYMSGSLVRTTAKFTDASGTLTDPSTVTLKYKAGTGSTQTPDSTKDSTGVYHYDIDTTGWSGPGNQAYTVQWTGTGAVQAIAVDHFEVEAAAL